MIAEAMQKILDLAPIQHETLEGEIYVKKGNGNGVERLKHPDQIFPDPLFFRTLAGFASYVKSNPDKLDIKSSMLHVADYNRVKLIGPMQFSNDNNRFEFAIATADFDGNRKGFKFDYYYPLEDFIIKLQSEFVRTEDNDDDADAIIDLLGKVANEHIRTDTDNGFSQTIQVRSGLTLKSSVQVKNPVVVHPWRTFGEIDQPLTNAILRFRKGSGDVPQVALFESGGDVWRMEAIDSIRQWLTKELPDMMVLA